MTNNNDFQVILVGDTNVGKTSIIYRACQDTFTEATQNTTGSCDFEYTNNIEGKLKILDTAGQEKFNSLTALYFRGKDAVIIVYSVDNRNSLDSIEERWMDSINENDIKVRYLVENKIDLRNDEPLSVEVSEEEGIQKADQLECAFYKVSAKSGINIQELFKEVFQSCLQQKNDNSFTTTTIPPNPPNPPSPPSVDISGNNNGQIKKRDCC